MDEANCRNPRCCKRDLQSNETWTCNFSACIRAPAAGVGFPCDICQAHTLVSQQADVGTHILPGLQVRVGGGSPHLMVLPEQLVVCWVQKGEMLWEGGLAVRACSEGEIKTFPGLCCDSDVGEKKAKQGLWVSTCRTSPQDSVLMALEHSCGTVEWGRVSLMMQLSSRSVWVCSWGT